MRHLLSIDDLDRSQIEQILDRAASFAEVSGREVKKVPALRGPARAQPLLRGLDAHALVLRAGRQDAVGRGHQLRLVRLLGREGRVAQGHGPDALGLPPLDHRRPLAARRRRPPRRPLGLGPRRQRGRRQARAPDPGAARRLHAAPAPGLARRQAHLDRRRRHALAGRALEHPRLHADGREGDRVRPSDAAPAQRRGAGLRRRLLARRHRGGRRRLRAADAARAHVAGLRAVAARVRRALPDQRGAGSGPTRC